MAEITEQYWSRSSKMNRSDSEWAFQQFLKEAANTNTSNSNPCSSSSTSTSTSTSTSSNVDVKLKRHIKINNNNNNNNNNSEDPYALLKAKLDLACAAVAMTRGSLVKSQDPPNNGSQASYPSEVAHQTTLKESGPCGNNPSTTFQNKNVKMQVVEIRSTTSGSSKEHSDDEEAEGEINMNGRNINRADSKRVRRMLSNRESARRSRRRKQAHLTDLETQVSQLRGENCSLLKRLTDITHKYNAAAVDNRVLKADVETLRAKVKMAEETVKRFTGLNPMFNAMSEISSMGMSLFNGSPSESSADASVPVQEDPNNHFCQPTSNNVMSKHDNGGVNNGLGAAIISSAENVQNNTAGGNKIGRTNSLTRVASLEHLQNRIRGGAYKEDK